MGKKRKFLMDYREREVMLAMGLMPLSGNLTPQYYIEDEDGSSTVNPESIEDMVEFTTSESLLEEEEFKNMMADALDSLTRREAKLLRLRFGIDMQEELTLEQIASIMNLTRERIRQIEAKALRKLRHPTRSNKFKAYVYPDAAFWSISAAINEDPPKIEDYEDWGVDGYLEYEKANFAWFTRVNEAKEKYEKIQSNIRGLI